MRKKIFLYLVLAVVFFNYPNILKAESKFLILLPLSGPYSPFGQDGRQGIDIALSELHQPLKVDFIYADSKADPSVSISEFKRAADLADIFGALALRGPVGMAINPISNSKQIPVLGGVANKIYTLNNPYAFQLWSDSGAEAQFLLESMLKLNCTTASLVTTEDDYPMAVSKDVHDLAGKHNIKIMSSHEFAPTETDFRTTALMVAKSKPDIIFVNLGVSQIAPFVKQLRHMKVQSKIISNFWVTKDEVLNALGQDAEGLFATEIATNYSKLNLDLKSKFNSSASGATVSSYVTTHMLNQALNLMPNMKIDKYNFYTSLKQLEKVETPNGTFIIEDRKVLFPLSLKIIEKSKPILYSDRILH